jgi:hypothetical protein
MTLWAILLGGLTLAGTAEARLGETIEECEERYGTKIKFARPDPEKDIFALKIKEDEKQRTVILLFIDERCEAVQYVRQGEFDPEELVEICKETIGQKKYKIEEGNSRLAFNGRHGAPRGFEGISLREPGMIYFYSDKYLRKNYDGRSSSSNLDAWRLAHYSGPFDINTDSIPGGQKSTIFKTYSWRSR